MQIEETMYLLPKLKSFITLTATIAILPMSSFAAGTVILKCDFEGPYYSPKPGDTIQQGCHNNYKWGKKDMNVVIDRSQNSSNASQRFDIRGISSGGIQFFVPGVKLNRDYYYKVTFKAKGSLEGTLGTCIRKIGKPWKTYIPGKSYELESDWKTYSFTGKAPTDLDRDIALTFGTGSLGQFWIDDIKIERFKEAPDDIKINTNPLVKGNIFPRTSFEGNVDYFWTSGIYAGPDGEWEDPQNYRAPEGKFGQFAMAIPSPKTEGTVFCRSFWLPVSSGSPYTFSVYLKSSKKKSPVKINVLSRNANKALAAKKCTLTNQWQRISLTTKPIPATTTDVYINITSTVGNGTIFVDGAQFESGTAATPYSPAYPYELYAGASGFKSNIFAWQEDLKINIRAASAQNSPSLQTLKTRIKVTAFPNHAVMDKVINLPVNKDYPLVISTKLNGLFRIKLSAVDTKSAAPQEILAAKLPLPRKTGKESAFGTHITIRPFFIDYAKKIGMKWTRLHDASFITKWRKAEPKPGKYQYFDKQINAVLDAGINILGLPDYPPVWAKQTDDSKNVINVKAFSKLCTKLAEHYRGRIDYWEVWNEPYIKYFFPGSPEQYAEVLSAGADALRAGNPQAKILGYCTEINDIEYAEKIPPAMRKKIDILSFHCYFQNLTGGGTSSFTKEVNAYLKFLRPFVPSEIWNTEGAYKKLGTNSFYSFMPASSGKINEKAAAFCARVWVEQLKGGINKLFIYTLHQSDTIMYYGGYKKLIGFDRSVTPAAAATATTAWCIDGLKNIPMEKYPGIVQGLFTNEKRCCWIVFDDSGVPGQKILHLNKIPPAIKLIDVMGNSPISDDRKLKIGIMPIFAISKKLSPAQLTKYCQDALE